MGYKTMDIMSEFVSNYIFDAGLVVVYGLFYSYLELYGIFV